MTTMIRRVDWPLRMKMAALLASVSLLSLVVAAYMLREQSLTPPLAQMIRQRIELAGAILIFALVAGTLLFPGILWSILGLQTVDGARRSALVETEDDARERESADAAVRASEERFQALEQNGWDAVHLLSAEGVILYESKSVMRVLGYHPEELVGHNSFEMIHPDDVATAAESFAPLASTPGLTLTAEVRVRHKDGSWRWMDCVATNLLEHRAVRAIAVNYRDITARKLADANIRQSEARYRNLFEALNEGFCTVEVIFDEAEKAMDYRFLEVNPAFERQTGLHNAQRRLASEVVPGREAHWLEIYGQVALTGKPAQFESAANAMGRHFDVCAYRVGGPESRRVGVLFNDITARKRAEQAVRKSEEYFHFLNDLAEATRPLASPAQIMAVTARMLGEHLHASRCAYADVENDGDQFTILHDYTDGCASTVGRYHLSLFGPRAVATLQSGQTLIVRNVETELLPDEGAVMFNAIGIKAIITCPLVKDGGLRAMMAVHQATPRDWKADEILVVQEVVERCWATIERRTAEDQLNLLNAELEQRVLERTEQLEAANKELEAFSYSVSHDLRAPLRTMDGVSQAVLEDYGPQLPEEGRRYLQTIREGAQRMAALIDDLLGFARLSRQVLTQQTVAMDLLVRTVLEELNPPQQERQIEIHVGELPTCLGDAALLKQVWLNLISNALKYTSQRNPAVVDIGCTLLNDTNTYFVRDNGTGFDMQYADKLFGVFQRLHRAEDYEGTGVGLAIVQRVVHRHGGRVWADASVDRGATFYFTLERERKS